MTTVVLGLDGACFELIQPWIDDGTLSSFSTLTEEGATTDMQSCFPPVTCPNWQCYATGTNPGKLGVFWWEEINREKQIIENKSTGADFDGTHYWHFLDGKKAIINLPTSYPPSEINGIHIAGGPGAEQAGYTHPEPLESELEREYNYAVHPEKMSLLSMDDQENDCIPEINRLIDSRFDVLENELDRGNYELIHMTVFYINVLQHFYWNKPVVKRAWKKIDERIGQILEKKELDNLFIMSDHGSNEINTTFRINTWLERHGYLQTKSSISDYLHSIGITQDRVRPLLAKLGLEWWARQLIPQRFQMYLPGKEGSVDRSGKSKVIDWERSQAVASGQGPVYALASDPRERKRISDMLIADLEGLTNQSGDPVFNQVLRGRDVYSGPYVDSGPDIVLDQAPGVHIEGKVGHDEVFGLPSKWRGENKDTGMFIGYGPDIDGTAKLPDMHILDIAPSLLHLHDEDIPKRMDGNVRYDIFNSDSNVADRTAVRIEVDNKDIMDSKEIQSDVTNRLEDLGYME